MAELATAFVRLRPNLTGFKSEADAGMAGAGSALGKVFAAAFGVVAVGELTKVTIGAATGQQAAFAKIAQITKSVGANVVSDGQTIQQRLVKMAEASGFSVEDLATSFGRLQQQTHNTSITFKDLGVAADAARGSNRAIIPVTTAVTRALAGNAQGLSRLGIIIPKYTVSADAIKYKLQELAHASTAVTQANAKQYTGTIGLNAAETAYAKLSPIQRANLENTLKNQAKQAALNDKLVGGAKALTEVGKRFAGQDQIYGNTAAGEADRFHVAITELEVSIGKALIPELASAASEGRKWADELSHNAEVGHDAAAVASGIGSAVHGIVDAFKLAYPAIKLTAEALNTIGSGPIIATYAAYKTGAIALGLYAKASTAVAAAKVKLGLGVSAELTTTTANTEAIIANTAAREANVVATGAQADAYLGFGGQLGVQTGEMTALSVATDGEVVSQEALNTAMLAFGPQAAILGIAAVVGGLYYLSTQTSIADDRAKALRKTLDSFDSTGVPTAKTDLSGAKLAADAAQNAAVHAKVNLDAAKAQLAADQVAGKGAAILATDQLRVRDALLESKQAASGYAGALDTVRTDGLKLDQSYKDQAAIVATLTTQVKTLTQTAKDSTAIDYGGHGGLLTTSSTDALKKYVAEWTKTEQGTSPLEHAQIDRIKQIALDTGKIPSQHTTLLILEDKNFLKQIQSDARLTKTILNNAANELTRTANLADRSSGLHPLVLKAITTPFSGKGSTQGIATQAADELKKGLKKGGADGLAAVAATPIDFRAVRIALTAAILQAKQNLTSLGSGLSSQIASVMDAALARSEAKITAADAKITASMNARNAAQTARDAAATGVTAAQTLAQLQAEFGSGPHTADQDAQLTAAKNAVLDAQDAIANAADQKRLDADAKTTTNLDLNEAKQKTAATRQIADWTDAANRGLITQTQFVKNVHGLLVKQGVNYKQAGSLLGSAFAEGFSEQLAGLIKQASKVEGLTPGQRGKLSGSQPVITSPHAAAVTAEKTLTDAIAAALKTKGGSVTLQHEDSLKGTGVSAPGEKIVKAIHDLHTTMKTKKPVAVIVGPGQRAKALDPAKLHRSLR